MALFENDARLDSKMRAVVLGLVVTVASSFLVMHFSHQWTFFCREFRYIAEAPASNWGELREVAAVVAWRVGLRRDPPPSYILSDVIEAIRDINRK